MQDYTECYLQVASAADEVGSPNAEGPLGEAVVGEGAGLRAVVAEGAAQGAAQTSS